uniref:Uncharacterized protein n=1 Tax=Candidatus Kentrum sp. MB TaxID=2138164 RepID=A0A451BFA5_9GAMM|nr:MAG: hypothetical protein BECKMB1821G_GA0114241_10829 [Candidatus Kentron sp. MB]VFK34712.1 MAG: hypothetical protein BECKMB1821I_GA0114274_10819 [Candidatus Kentron sp. MB]VFK76960.1 MAG: hypothetical protein BECKMB1821H_GA0114242_10868 [Candidatus Kentron sp. MB]
MLADSPPINARVGSFEPEVHLPRTARYALLDFIADELPRWRDHPGREPEIAEVALTSQLRRHLNSAARISTAWNWIRFIQFGTEDPDETKPGRTIDLTSEPCGVVLFIEGRRHTQFDTLLPIECKRLPTPKGKDRDKREYVVSAKGSTGGIQRFKFGHHGAAHRVAGMIAYVQERTSDHWLKQVNGWIGELAKETDSGWSASDTLQTLKDYPAAEVVCRLCSRHKRQNGREAIDLRHLWIKMD